MSNDLNNNSQTPASNVTVNVTNAAPDNSIRNLFYLAATGILAAGAVDVYQNGPVNSVTGKLLHGQQDTTINQITVKNNIPSQKGLMTKDDFAKFMEEQKATMTKDSTIAIFPGIDSTQKASIDTTAQQRPISDTVNKIAADSSAFKQKYKI